MHDRTKVYIDGSLAVTWDGVHMATSRQCQDIALSAAAHQVVVLGFEYIQDSQLEVTYAGPDTFDVRTLIGGKPFSEGCDPTAPTSAVNSFTLCTYKSEPTWNFVGDCTPTVGIAHPRFAGPCAKAINTTSINFNWYSAGWSVPVLGSADELWVRLKKYISYWFSI
jgi:hypothetical protein